MRNKIPQLVAVRTRVTDPFVPTIPLLLVGTDGHGDQPSLRSGQTKPSQTPTPFRRRWTWNRSEKPKFCHKTRSESVLKGRGFWVKGTTDQFTESCHNRKVDGDGGLYHRPFRSPRQFYSGWRRLFDNFGPLSKVDLFMNHRFTNESSRVRREGYPPIGLPYQLMSLSVPPSIKSVSCK